tara:strand:+ start:272 stop:595 length:324 start_codon:yes stop_codon:yes gene_type:complete
MKFNLLKLSKDNLLFEREHPNTYLECARQIIIFFKTKDGKDYTISMYNGKRIVDNDLEIAKEGKQYTSFYWEVLPIDEEQEVYLHISEIDEYINSVMEDKKLTLNIY